jgi:hypothetical protein
MSVPTSSVVGINQPTTIGTATATVVGAVFTNVADACGVVQGMHNPPNVTTLTLGGLFAGTPATGTYPIGVSGAGSYAVATYSSTNGNCVKSYGESATSGTVTLTNITATEIDGSFDVTFSSGDHLTGSFSAPVCSVPTSDGGTAACGS